MMDHVQPTEIASAMPKTALQMIPTREAWSGQVWTHLGAIAFLFMAAIILALRPEWATGLSPQCVMLSFFHIKCPFCGMTRDFIAILHGQPTTLNPFTWATVAALYIGYPCVFLLTWRKRRLDIFYRPTVYKVGCVGLIVMCLVNNLLR